MTNTILLALLWAQLWAHEGAPPFLVWAAGTACVMHACFHLYHTTHLYLAFRAHVQSRSQSHHQPNIIGFKP